MCANTVAKLLKGLEFRLRVNHKKLSRHSPPDRDAQFAYIAAQREGFARQGLPIVSIDSKKRELVGNFKNNGATWSRYPTAVIDHDFRSDAEGIALPYGVYDLSANHPTRAQRRRQRAAKAQMSTWVECWRGGSSLRLGPDQVVDVAFQHTDLGPAVDRTALVRFQHPPFELCMRFARTQLTDGLLSMVTQPPRRPAPLSPDAKSPHLGSRTAHRDRDDSLAVAHSRPWNFRTLTTGVHPSG